mgnify:FL=1
MQRRTHPIPSCIPVFHGNFLPQQQDATHDPVESDIAKLCTRYNTYGKKNNKTKAVDNPIPLDIKASILDTFTCTTERMTTPFTVHPTTCHYWTEHADDAAFGANHGSLSVRWTGLSVATPPCDIKQALRALAWALQSAQHTRTPTLAILALPLKGDKDNPYQAIMNSYPGWCRRLLTIPHTAMQKSTPGTSPFQTQPPSKWWLHIISVGNMAGYASLGPNNPSDHTWLYRLSDTCTTHLKEKQEDNKQVVCIECHPRDWLQEPKWTINRLPRTNAFKQSKWITPTQIPPEGWKAPNISTCTRLETSTPPPLRFNWRDFYYTDGSAVNIEGKGVSIAAAIFKPADRQEGAAHTHTTNCTITSGPRREQHDRYLPNVNTITRAELVGIREACVLANPGPTEEIHIATDSQTSMYQIHKMVTHPQNMQEHRHHSLLTDIVQRLRDSQATLHLWKVTSHIGVYGKEMADHMAVQVAKKKPAGRARSCSGGFVRCELQCL